MSKPFYSFTVSFILHAVYFYRHTCTGNESRYPKTEHTCTCIIQFWLPSDNLSCAFQDGLKNIKLLTDDRR